MKVIVDISDAKVSAEAEDELVTFSLGSCIGVALYDARVRVGGLLHYQLPSSTADTARAAERPLMYADTGMECLLAEMTKLGASKRRMSVRITGGAKMLNDHLLFDIGRRNHAAIRKILWQQGMFITAEHVGGKLPRNMQLNIGDGTLLVKYNNETLSL